MKNIELFHGDCFELMKEIPDSSVDLILTDPPYSTTEFEWDNDIDLTLMWEQFDRVIKDNGAMVIFGGEPFSSKLRLSNLSEWKYDYVWVKSRAFLFVHAHNAPMRKHEMVSVFSKAKIKHEGEENRMNYYPQGIIPYNKIVKGDEKGKRDKSSFRIDRPCWKKEYNREYTNYPDDILSFASEGNPLHPTQKPLALVSHLIKTYTLKGDTVLDPFMGSGTTGLACKNIGRKFIGMELDDKYFDIASQRINNGFVQEDVSEMKHDDFALF